ncbi:unnamed protein product, partial [Didymodactylos carnosus]
VFAHPERYSLDEFWTPSAKQSVDTTNRNFPPPPGWWNSLWHPFRNFMNNKLPKELKDKLIVLYGPNKILTQIPADILYVPLADRQSTVLVQVINEIMTLFPTAYCEVIFIILVDLTSVLCKHWPYQNDRPLFRSSVNLLNNLSVIRKMEDTNQIINSRNPYNRSQFQERPSQLNPHGYIWTPYRTNEKFYQTTLSTGIFPAYYHSKLQGADFWHGQTEFIHPLKLSNPNNWQARLWQEAMKSQIHRFYQQQTQRRLTAAVISVLVSTDPNSILFPLILPGNIVLEAGDRVK